MMIDMEGLADLIKTRRSVRRYQDRPVPEEVLLQAVELATWAPNSGGRQTWHFTVVTNRETIRQVADAVDAVTQVMAGWPEAQSEEIKSSIERWKVTGAFFRSAPALVAVSMGEYISATDRLTVMRADVDPVAAEIVESRRVGSSRLQTAAAAVTALLLIFHAQGLGACWMAGPQQAKRQIEAILGVPGDYNFVALVPVGYPAEEPKPRARKAMDEMVTVLR
jgi:nitroreductase